MSALVGEYEVTAADRPPALAVAQLRAAEMLHTHEVLDWPPEMPLQAPAQEPRSSAASEGQPPPSLVPLTSLREPAPGAGPATQELDFATRVANALCLPEPPPPEAAPAPVASAEAGGERPVAAQDRAPHPQEAACARPEPSVESPEVSAGAHAPQARPAQQPVSISAPAAEESSLLPAAQASPRQAQAPGGWYLGEEPDGPARDQVAEPAGLEPASLEPAGPSAEAILAQGHAQLPADPATSLRPQEPKQAPLPQFGSQLPAASPGVAAPHGELGQGGAPDERDSQPPPGPVPVGTGGTHSGLFGFPEDLQHPPGCSADSQHPVREPAAPPELEASVGENSKQQSKQNIYKTTLSKYN